MKVGKTILKYLYIRSLAEELKIVNKKNFRI